MLERPIHILLVDDDEDYYVLTRGLIADIQGPGYELKWISNYQAGLEALRRGEFDVCLLDFHLGQQTGLEFLREATERGISVPIVMLTGQGDHAVDLEAMHAGAADYLTKGKVDTALLERAIRYAIDRARVMEELRQKEKHIADLYTREQEQLQKLERAYSDLRRAERLRDDMSHMIIHDLRNPLTAMKSSLDIIASALDDPERQPVAKRFLGTARAASDDMAGLIEDMLNVSKLEAGELHPALEPVALGELLARRQEDYRLQAERSQKALTIEVDPALPPVPADSALVGRVMDNLVSNALKYTAKGGHIAIRAGLDSGTALIEVQDDGEGIPPDYHERIFEKFVQVRDQQGVPLRKGIGLGLAFCRLAVEAHHGKIWVESSPGHGSTFRISLPLT